jgi:serine/threonine protein kinase
LGSIRYISFINIKIDFNINIYIYINIYKIDFIPSVFVITNLAFRIETGHSNFLELNDYYLTKYFGDIDIFDKTLVKYINNDSKLIFMKSDLGSVYVFDNIVVKIMNIMKEISEETKYVEKIIEIINGTNHFIIISKKYESNNNINIKRDIFNALSILDKYNISHKDISIDNIVYDKENDCYVLIDFDMISNEYQKHIFRESFRNL